MTSQVDIPTLFTVVPSNKNLIFQNLKVDTLITIGWYRGIETLTANNQVPILPLNHHEVIVWGATKKVANFFGNNDMYLYALNEYKKGMQKLKRDQVPAKKILVRPMA